MNLGLQIPRKIPDHHPTPGINHSLFLSHNLLKMHRGTQRAKDQSGDHSQPRGLSADVPWHMPAHSVSPLGAPEHQMTKMTGCTKIQTHYKWPFYSFCFVCSEQLASFSELSVLYLRHSTSLK